MSDTSFILPFLAIGAIAGAILSVRDDRRWLMTAPEYHQPVQVGVVGAILGAVAGFVLGTVLLVLS